MEPLVQGLNLPTAFVSTPNGRILIAEKAGIVRVFDGTRLLSAPFINLSGEVDSRGDMGLLGLTLDPAYESNGYVYLLFTHTSGYSRLVRVTSDPADKDVAQTGSQLVLLGACPDPTRDQDCMRTNSGIHAIGTVLFGADGSLFVGNGDNSFANVDHPTALRAQDLDSLQGKILRINPQTGEGYPDNPFYNGDPRSNRSKVWAYGLRNPFRFTRDPGTGRIVIGDVGWNGWEEINVGRGANFGWPCYEGGDSSSVRQRDYESYDGCRALYSQGINAVTAPLFGGKHFTWRSITMGDFYSGTAFPEPYRDALFFADYGTNRIYYAHVTLDGLAPQISTVTQFASGVSGTVQLSMGPNGTLYQLNIADGRLERIRYTGVQAPIVVASASPEVEPALPALITFSSAGSAGRNGLPLSYTWDFGDGTPPVETADTTVAHTYSVAGVYDVLLAASDGTASNSTQVRVVVGNEPPTAQIAAPSAGLAFRIGDIISFSGSGSDAEDGVLTGDALTWRVDILHDDHVHYNEYTTTGSAGSFVAADHEDRMGYEICLTARDSVDLTATDCVRIAPEEVIYTVDTVPSGLQIAFSGVSRTTPFQVTTAINGVRSLSAPLMQNGYLFQSWSDGSQADHNITILDAPQTLTATYLEVPTGNNLLQNGSFDQGLQFWQREPTHTWVQAKQSAGNNYIATWPWNQYLFFQNSITVEAGVTHVACADFFTDTTNSYVVKIRLTENGTPVGLDQVLERGYNCYAFSPTRSTSNARFELYFDGLRTSGTQLNFDNLSLVGGSGSAAPATPTATATATPTSAAGPQPTATPTATSVPNSGPSATPTAATASASELVQNGEFDAGLQDWLRDPGHNWVQIAASNGDAYVNTWPWNGYTFLQEGLEIERGRQYRACVDFFTTTTYSYAVWLRLMDGSNRAGLEQQLTPGEHCFDFAATLSSANARLELTFSNLRTGGTKLSFDALSLAPISGTTAPNPTATHTATATGTPTTSAPPTATATSATEASLTPTATAPPAASETPTATPEPPTATITATNTPSPPATGEDTELLQNGDFSAGLQDWQRDPGHSWVQLGNGGGNPFIKTWPWNGYTFFQRGLTLEEGRAYRACVDFSTSTANPYAVQLRMMDGTTPLGLDESLTPGRNCFQFTATGSSTTGRFELAFSALRVGGTRLDFASASLVRLGTSAVPTPTATQTPTISPATATSTPNAGPSATPTVTALPSATPSPTPASTSEELLQNGSFESLLQGWGRSPEHNWIQVRQRNGGDRYAIMWPWNGYEFFQGAIPVEQGASYRACVTFFTDTTYSYAVRLQLTDGASNLGLDEPLVRGDQCFTFTASGSATAGRLLLYFSNLRVGGTSLSFDNLSLKRLQPSG